MDIFVAIDGDDVGSKIENFILMGTLEKLSQFSRDYKKAMSWLSGMLKKEMDASIIFDGGDSLLAVIPNKSFDNVKLESIRKQYFEESTRTISIGVGKSSRKAYVALKIAKTSGKNCLVHFKGEI